MDVCCYNLQFSKSITEMVEGAKVKNIQAKENDLRLKLMKTMYKNSKCATLSMHQRFLVSISENNVPRLQQLITVA